MNGSGNEKNISLPIVYTEEEMAAYEEMIKREIGESQYVMHEIVSPDLHIDIILIPPTEEKPYYTLVTMGMGAYKMPVPPYYENMNRAEIAIRLPADWKIGSGEEKWYWPIRVLKTLARMPFQEESWIGLYHDIDFGHPFSDNTDLCAVVLEFYDEEMDHLTFDNGDELIVYQAVPIYRSELKYLYQNDAEALLEKLGNHVLQEPVNIHRDPAV